MTRIENDCVYNIEDFINGRWVLRYRNWLTLEEAQEKYEWLTNSDYWLAIAPNYRIVKLSWTVEEIERYKP